MYRYLFLLLLLTYNGCCDDCVVFNFENGLQDFTNYSGLCIDREIWVYKQYSELPKDPPHKNSTSFITPMSKISCMTSPTFPMAAGGTLDVKLFTEQTTSTDLFTILAFQCVENGFSPNVGVLILSAKDLTRGWQNVRLSLVGIGNFNGFIILMGSASESSTILIDSIRYIAPTYNEELCQAYDSQNIDEDGNHQGDTSTTSLTDYYPEITMSTPTTITENNLDTTSTSSHYTSDYYTNITMSTPVETSTENYLTTSSTSSPYTISDYYTETELTTNNPVTESDMSTGRTTYPETTYYNSLDTSSTRSPYTTSDYYTETELTTNYPVTESDMTTDRITYPETTYDNALDTSSTSEPHTSTEIDMTTYPETTTDNYLDKNSTSSFNGTSDYDPDISTTTYPESTTDKTSTRNPNTTTDSNPDTTEATSPETTRDDYVDTASTSSPHTTTTDYIEAIVTTNQETVSDTIATISPDVGIDDVSLTTTTDPETTDLDTSTNCPENTDCPCKNSTKSIFIKMLLKVVATF